MRKLTRPAGALNEDFPLKNFLDIKFGDYVVHNRYGIGKFLGFEKIKITDDYQEHRQ
ncbi:MAG: CarD family transcriptional regulator [Candidatus Omnitrophota bacterium]